MLIFLLFVHLVTWVAVSVGHYVLFLTVFLNSYSAQGWEGELTLFEQINMLPSLLDSFVANWQLLDLAAVIPHPMG